MFKQDFTCPALLKNKKSFYLYRTITYFCQPFQTVPVLNFSSFGLSAFARHY